MIAIVRRMAKHKSVLRQNTFKTLLKSVLPKQKVFCKTHLCFQSVGHVCWISFWKDRWFQENMESRQNHFFSVFFSARSVCPPPFPPPIQVFQIQRSSQIAGLTLVSLALDLTKQHGIVPPAHAQPWLFPRSNRWRIIRGCSQKQLRFLHEGSIPHPQTKLSSHSVYLCCQAKRK